MKYCKIKFRAFIPYLCFIIGGFIAWRLMPPSADGMRNSAVVVGQTSWHEVRVDGKPCLYFSDAIGDTALLGVTANRDSAIHRHRLAGCWTNRLPLFPSCFGRIATAYAAPPRHPRVKGDSSIVRLCRQSIATQLKTLKTQKTELDYYLRVHGVQDNGYQSIAALATRVAQAYSDVSRAARMLDSLANGRRHRFTINSMTQYSATFRDSKRHIAHAALKPIFADSHKRFMLLQTCDESTPDGASPVSPTLWGSRKECSILAVGHPGLGEPGLECDTVSPAIIPGHKFKDSRHDLPRVLAADGSPVFTERGMFIGITSGNTIVEKLKEEKK